jgi:hypothetical protein
MNELLVRIRSPKSGRLLTTPNKRPRSMLRGANEGHILIRGLAGRAEKSPVTCIMFNVTARNSDGLTAEHGEQRDDKQIA